MHAWHRVLGVEGGGVGEVVLARVAAKRGWVMRVERKGVEFDSVTYECAVRRITCQKGTCTT